MDAWTRASLNWLIWRYNIHLAKRCAVAPKEKQATISTPNFRGAQHKMANAMTWEFIYAL